MGRLIATGVEFEGHSVTFQYLGLGVEQKCLMNCACGWSVYIDSFKESWSLIETKVRFQRHLKELGNISDEQNTEV